MRKVLLIGLLAACGARAEPDPRDRAWAEAMLAFRVRYRAGGIVLIEKRKWNEVAVDWVDVYVRADFDRGHDSWWKSGAIELSDGRRISFELRTAAERPTVPLPVEQWPPRPIRWMRFVDLVPGEDQCGAASPRWT